MPRAMNRCGVEFVVTGAATVGASTGVNRVRGRADSLDAGSRSGGRAGFFSGVDFMAGSSLSRAEPYTFHQLVSGVVNGISRRCSIITVNPQTNVTQAMPKSRPWSPRIEKPSHVM
jgi:hypothetical protein